jgi:hypothetical protein
MAQFVAAYDVCNIDHLYNKDHGFEFSFPRKFLEEYLSGKAFDNPGFYTEVEARQLRHDINSIFDLIRDGFAFHYGTTATGAATGKFFAFLKAHGYQIRVIHVTAPDDVRWASIEERDKTFVQTTESDTRDKGDLLPQRITDTYLTFADEIEFCYRDGVKEDAILAAKWTRNPGAEKGTLEVLDVNRYDKIKTIHNAVAERLGRPDLNWKTAVEETSEVL